MLNKVILIGRLGRDPEVRRLNNGNAVASFSLATDETWRDKASGERQSRTTWHNIVVFNDGLVKVCENYLKKGAMVYIEGQLQTREYEDKDGVDRKVTEVVLNQFRGELKMLDGKSKDKDEADDDRPRRPARSNRDDEDERPRGRSSGGRSQGPNDDIPW